MSSHGYHGSTVTNDRLSMTLDYIHDDFPGAVSVLGVTPPL